MLKAVLFDLDDTLWRSRSTASEPPDFAALQQAQAGLIRPLLVALGSRSSELDAQAVIAGFWDRWTPERQISLQDPSHAETDGAAIMRSELAVRGIEATWEQSNDFWEQILSQLSNQVEPFEDTHQTLDRLRSLGLKTTIVTNRPHSASHLEPHLEKAGLRHRFDAIITSLDVGFRKPHPLMFATALQTLGVEAREAMMVGDSFEVDIAPALDLGMAAVWRTDDESAVCAEVLRVRRLGDLLELDRYWVSNSG